MVMSLRPSRRCRAAAVTSLQIEVAIMCNSKIRHW
jgi:hypothetical protein